MEKPSGRSAWPTAAGLAWRFQQASRSPGGQPFAHRRGPGPSALARGPGPPDTGALARPGPRGGSRRLGRDAGSPRPAPRHQVPDPVGGERAAARRPITRRIPLRGHPPGGPTGRLPRDHTYGCGPTITAGSMLTELIAGRTIAECRALTTEDLIGALDGVPPEKLPCPALAVAALHDARDRWEPRMRIDDPSTEE